MTLVTTVDINIPAHLDKRF